MWLVCARSLEGNQAHGKVQTESWNRLGPPKSKWGALDRRKGKGCWEAKAAIGRMTTGGLALGLCLMGCPEFPEWDSGLSGLTFGQCGDRRLAAPCCPLALPDWQSAGPPVGRWPWHAWQLTSPLWQSFVGLP